MQLHLIFVQVSSKVRMLSADSNAIRVCPLDLWGVRQQLLRSAFVEYTGSSQGSSSLHGLIIVFVM